MRRRDFIQVSAGSAALWPFAARAQQLRMPVVGFLRNTSAESSAHLVTGFRQGLGEVGYMEGQNLQIEFRWSEGRDDDLPRLALDLVRRPVAVFVAANLTSLVAAKAATDTIPIVFVTGDDPIQLGFVASFNRPAENVTGVSFYSGTLGAKQVELLHEIVPNATTIGMVVNPNNPAAATQINVAEDAARALGLKIVITQTRNEHDFELAFATLIHGGIAALLIGGDALFNGQRNRLAGLAAHHKLPVIHFAREYIAAGGLMVYGASIVDAYRQVGVYVGRLLKGTKPGELPVMLPTKFELAINLKAAKALGLEISPTLLARADEVIE